MHSKTIGKTRFHFNQDFSGEVLINEESTRDPQISVPFADLAAFVALAIRAKKPKRIKKPEAK